MTIENIEALSNKELKELLITVLKWKDSVDKLQVEIFRREDEANRNYVEIVCPVCGDLGETSQTNRSNPVDTKCTKCNGKGYIRGFLKD